MVDKRDYKMTLYSISGIIEKASLHESNIFSMKVEKLVGKTFYHCLRINI